ncbi:STAS domain-containing protein [Bacillus salacetis]|uniref:STAS domain-containing protein n=1 Tax=Bacillus salacetis TaxID=2315464 RepID=A0A3A1R163_9BACI|nr:STAS domain-containing protein [Bacillus salacetis]RIW34677.1 STAS domain-containing protein [Bacillus salacetis]
MKTTIYKLAAFLKAENTQIANDIVDSVILKMNLSLSDVEVGRAINMYQDLLEFLSLSLQTENMDIPEELIEWSKQNAYAQVSANKKISEIILRYPPTREIFTDFVSRWAYHYQLSTEEYTLVLKKINRMLDVSLEKTVIAFEEYNAKVKEGFEEEIDIISFPIVPLTENMAVVPLVGRLDEHRANHLIDSVLPKVNNLKINYLIMDFSGVCEIDELAARSIHNAVSMLKLLGIQVISTGISPKLAYTAVSIGVGAVGVNSYQSVRQALESLNS